MASGGESRPVVAAGDAGRPGPQDKNQNG